MQINIDEQLMPLSEVSQYVPRPGGKKVHTSTLYRWSTIGCRGVVLETLQAGSTRVCSREAVARFFERLTMAAHGRAATPDPIRPATDDVAVRQELDDAGI